jgi:hypothetical protein
VDHSPQNCDRESWDTNLAGQLDKGGHSIGRDKGVNIRDVLQGFTMEAIQDDVL